MANPHIRLLFYAFAVSGACVEIFGSIEVGVWHPLLYWAAVACIIPCGLIGILRIKQVYAAPAHEFQAIDLPKPIAPPAFLTMVPATMSGDLRFGPPAPPILANRRPLPKPQLMVSDGMTRARRERLVERC